MRKIVLVILLILVTILSKAQYLTFDQLLSVQQKDVIEVEEYLTAKGWIFYDAEKKGASLNIVTFAYDKSSYSNEALIWLNFIYSGTSAYKRVSYQIHDPNEYNNLVNRIKSLGYKLIDTNISDGSITKIYSNNKKTVEVESTANNNNFKSSTVYHILLIDTHDYHTNYARIIGMWELNDVIVDMESLPEEAKVKMADPAMKPMMDAMIQEMVKQGMTFEFKADGNAVVTMRGKEETGTYVYKDKKLTINDTKGAKTLDVTVLTNADMAFEMEEDGMKMTMKFKRRR